MSKTQSHRKKRLHLWEKVFIAMITTMLAGVGFICWRVVLAGYVQSGIRHDLTNVQAEVSAINGQRSTIALHGREISKLQADRKDLDHRVSRLEIRVDQIPTRTP